MLQLANTTPFAAILSLLPDADGIDTVFVVVKATFTLGPQITVAAEQLPVLAADAFWGEPGESSLRYAAELHLAKPATDIALVGSAHAPQGRPVDQMDTLVSVGAVRKAVRVVAERPWTGSAMGSAKGPARPFTTMPLVYERAFGGVHVIDEAKGKVMAVQENPVGAGFRARQRRQELKGQLAPCLLDPRDEERPAGYGFIAPSWKPRLDFAGTYDEAWERRRAPFLPEDFDARFFNAAHPDLIADGYLVGGEEVNLVGVSPRGLLSFGLPRCSFDMTARVAGRVEQPALNLETVLFEPDDERLTMLWRAAIPCDKQALQVEQVEVALSDLANVVEVA